MHKNLVDRIRPTLDPGNHPYMSGPFQPNYTEFDATDLEVIGEVVGKRSSDHLFSEA